MRKFDLILPAYNEARSLPKLIAKVQEATLAAHFTPETFKLWVVNNGSTDATAKTLQKLRAGPLGAWFDVVTVERNQGYGHGLYSGLQAANAAYIGWSHADLQCDPRDAFLAYARASQAAMPTLVKGVRRGRNWKDKFVTRTFEACAYGLLNLDIEEINAQPKVFPRALVAEFKSPPKSFAFDLYALYCAKKNNLAIETIQVDFPAREHGVSKWASSLVGRYKTIFGMVGYMWELTKQEGRL